MSVTFTTNAGNLGTRKRILAGQTEEQFRSAAKAHAERMKAAAEVLSAGPLTTMALRNLGHPYARRLPVNSGPLPDYIINSQSGEFRASWVTRVQKTRIGWTVTLYNTSDHARFMVGTRNMRVRPILEEVDRRASEGMPQDVGRIVRRSAAANGGTAPMSVWGGLAYAVAVGVASAADGVSEGLSG